MPNAWVVKWPLFILISKTAVWLLVEILIYRRVQKSRLLVKILNFLFMKFNSTVFTLNNVINSWKLTSMNFRFSYKWLSCKEEMTLMNRIRLIQSANCSEPLLSSQTDSSIKCESFFGYVWTYLKLKCFLWRVSCLPPNYQHSPSLNRRPSPGSRREWVCERGGAL